MKELCTQVKMADKNENISWETKVVEPECQDKWHVLTSVNTRVMKTKFIFIFEPEKDF